MNKPNYSKPYKTYDQQIELLKSRGLIIDDPDKATKYLAKIGYYRLSGYLYSFRHIATLNNKPQREDRFLCDVSFSHIVDIYVFDKKLRLILLDAIERIEIAVRSRIAYEVGRHDPYDYLNDTLINKNYKTIQRPKETKSKLTVWEEDFERCLRKSKDEFIRHFKEKYSSTSKIPIWISIEIWTFSMISKYFEMLYEHHQKTIVQDYGVQRPTLLRNWIHNIGDVRNICAHHGRLWNRKFVNSISPPGRDEIVALGHLLDLPSDSKNKIYPTLCVLIFLMKSIYPKSKWMVRLREHILAFPEVPHVNFVDMGFPKNWESEQIWK